LNLKDLEAMANLSLYNAKKFRAALYLNQGNPAEARNAIRMACCYWQKYTNMMDELYKGVDLQRNSDFSSWHANDEKALQDFAGLGGVGLPGCSDDELWVYIKSPANNALLMEPANVMIDVLADAGNDSIERIELICNDSLVDTDYDDPYGFELTGLLSGTYTLEAVAYDYQGTSVSYRVNIFVNNPDSLNKVPWIEDFSLPDGSTIDNGLTSWTSTRSEGNLLVQNNSFVVNDAGTEGTLTTGSIDISQGPVNISLDLWSEGSLESDDYVQLYKKVDDGPETLIGIKTGNQNARTSIAGSATGSMLVLVVRTRVSYSSEYYYMDDLQVTYMDPPEKLDQTIAFPELPGVKVGDPDFDPGAAASSGLEVTYSSSDAQVASIMDGKIHIIKEGISEITASQAGNEIYHPAPDISRSLTIINTTYIETLQTDVNLYPNPATNEVYIQVDDEYTLSLVNLTGIEVMNKSHLVGLNEIDVTDLKRGIYFANIQGGNHFSFQKVVLQ
jgi:hypothetical protein